MATGTATCHRIPLTGRLTIAPSPTWCFVAEQKECDRMEFADVDTVAVRRRSDRVDRRVTNHDVNVGSCAAVGDLVLSVQDGKLDACVR